MTLSCFNSEAKLNVTIENIRHSTGQIRVGLYAACENFPMGCKPIASQVIDASGNNVHLAFDVKPGDYAVALFHDVNGNGKLDKNLFGIPKEPYGFSNNYRPRVSGPVFADCRVRLGASEKTISIKLI
ncbi:DUF2141 domain-containing protein [Larkinella terrae]|nr:DUF2141 domain-containing protein [Larkinella terrae]